MFYLWRPHTFGMVSRVQEPGLVCVADFVGVLVVRVSFSDGSAAMAVQLQKHVEPWAI